MIKFKFRKNFLYALAVYVFSYIRKTIVILIEKIYGFSMPYLYLFMMNLGQISGGGLIYAFHIITWEKKKEVQYSDSGLELIHNETLIEAKDGKFKILLLIFFAAYLDFVEFIIEELTIPYISGNISPTIDSRLGCLSTISSSLVCTYALRFKVGKHHKISLFILGLCLVLTIILELIFNWNDITLNRFILAHFLVCIFLINVTFTDCIERYLADYNYINPFIIIMAEGIMELIMSSFLSIGKSPFKEMKKQYEKNDLGKFILLIFFLFLYLVLSACLNAYKVYCNVVYSPMMRSLMDFFLNPFLNIYFFVLEDDFQKNFLYFFICEIICLIVDFFSCVYNEYITIFYLGLEHDTKDQITERGIKTEMVDLEYNAEEDIISEDNVS